MRISAYASAFLSLPLRSIVGFSLAVGCISPAFAQEAVREDVVEVVPPPSSDSLVVDAPMVHVAVSSQPDYRVLSSLRNDARFQRTWSHTFSSETDVLRNSRKTHMVDHQHHRLQAEVQVIGAGPQFRVHVLQSRSTPSIENRGVQALPTAGSVLICSQASTGRVTCIDEIEESPVEWPAWAPLDLNPWVTSAPIQPNYRWRRSILNADQLGWLNSDSDVARVTLGITNTSVEQSSIATMSGSVVANAHTTIIGVDVPYEIVGTISASFDPSQQLLNQVEVHLSSLVNHASSSQGVPFTWTREVSTRLTIATEGL